MRQWMDQTDVGMLLLPSTYHRQRLRLGNLVFVRLRRQLEWHE